MYVAQQCFGLPVDGTEDAIYDSQTVRGLVGIDLAREAAPDANALLKLPEPHRVGQKSAKVLKNSSLAHARDQSGTR